MFWKNHSEEYVYSDLNPEDRESKAFVYVCLVSIRLPECAKQEIFKDIDREIRGEKKKQKLSCDRVISADSQKTAKARQGNKRSSARKRERKKQQMGS